MLEHLSLSLSSGRETKEVLFVLFNHSCCRGGRGLSRDKGLSKEVWLRRERPIREGNLTERGLQIAHTVGTYGPGRDTAYGAQVEKGKKHCSHLQCVL